MCACNSSTWEVKAGESLQGYTVPQQVETSLGSVRPNLRARSLWKTNKKGSGTGLADQQGDQQGAAAARAKTSGDVEEERRTGRQSCELHTGLNWAARRIQDDTGATQWMLLPPWERGRFEPAQTELPPRTWSYLVLELGASVGRALGTVAPCQDFRCLLF